jgi:site-specific recombinase XerD
MFKLSNLKLFSKRHVSTRSIKNRDYAATLATQLLNADTALVTIQDLLGYTRIKTTQRYCRVSNLKVQRDYHRAVTAILQITR